VWQRGEALWSQHGPVRRTPAEARAGGARRGGSKARGRSSRVLQRSTPHLFAVASCLPRPPDSAWLALLRGSARALASAGLVDDHV